MSDSLYGEYNRIGWSSLNKKHISRVYSVRGIFGPFYGMNRGNLDVVQSFLEEPDYELVGVSEKRIRRGFDTVHSNLKEIISKIPPGATPVIHGRIASFLDTRNQILEKHGSAFKIVPLWNYGTQPEDATEFIVVRLLGGFQEEEEEEEEDIMKLVGAA